MPKDAAYYRLASPVAHAWQRDTSPSIIISKLPKIKTEIGLSGSPAFSRLIGRGSCCEGGLRQAWVLYFGAGQVSPHPEERRNQGLIPRPVCVRGVPRWGPRALPACAVRRPPEAEDVLESAQVQLRVRELE